MPTGDADESLMDRLPPLTVLVADDDPVARFMVRGAVERFGHTCTLAGDGVEALARFEHERPQVVITDWRMPGLDGTTLTQRIRDRGHHGYTYVIVITGEADDAAALEAMRAGADELIEKPLDGAALERRLVSARRVIELHDRLRADARIDALTGIANRRAMDEELAVLLMRADRYDHELAIVLLDLDSFKGYNDGRGHLAGDQLLSRIATTLREVLRDSDGLYRYGGEEFLALLPGQDTDSAQIAAERLCQAVRELGIPHPAGGVITISGGTAAHAGGETPVELLTRADRALYAAKLAGRDRVRAAETLSAAQ